MNKHTRLVLRNQKSNKVIGYIDSGAKCHNSECVALVSAGKLYHAIPAASVSLPTYHYATLEEAIAVLEACDMRGRS